MLGLAIVATAILASLLIKLLLSVFRGRRFSLDAEDLFWYALALAVVTNFFGLIPTYLSSPTTALSTVDELLHWYYGIMNTLVTVTNALSLSMNLGLPVVEHVVTMTNPWALLLELVEVVVESVTTAFIHYLARVISILIEVMLVLKFAVLIGLGLAPLVPYLAALMVLPRVRYGVAVPVMLYLVLGVAVPIAINMAHAHPVVQIISIPQLPHWVGFVNAEVTDATGKPVPAVLCIVGPGYSETVGLPTGVGLVPLPAYIRFGVVTYTVDCVVTLFLRFPVNVQVVPSIGPSVPTIMINLPMIAVFNGSNPVALFNYTWVGNGGVVVKSGAGYAVVNVTTPCTGNLTLSAYAGDLILSLPREVNCSVTYLMNESVPRNLVTQSWIQEVLLEHEVFCQDISDFINPSPTYAPQVPPQVLEGLLRAFNESCNGNVGDYRTSMDELRNFNLVVSLKCFGRCNDTDLAVTIVGVRPYGLNYYALWSGTYVTWLNQSVALLRNVVEPLSAGLVINLLVNLAYYVALILGLVGVVYVAPRIVLWSRLRSFITTKLSIGYEDLTSIVTTVAGPVVKRAASRLVSSGRVRRLNAYLSRYVLVMGIVRASRSRYVRHMIRAGYWSVRWLPRVSAAPYVLVPALYGASVLRDYLLRRVEGVEGRLLRSTLRSFVRGAVGPTIVLRPYSAVGIAQRHLIAALTKRSIDVSREVAHAYSVLRDYLSSYLALYVAVRASMRGLGTIVVRDVEAVYGSMDDPVRALMIINDRLSPMRLLDRELATAVAREAIRTLVSKFPELSRLGVVVGGAVRGPELVHGLEDYESVTVRVGGRDAVVKAWIVKEVLNVIGGRGGESWFMSRSGSRQFP